MNVPLPYETCVRVLSCGGKILICGNGGSAAQASHFAAELVVRYAKNRRALPCIALSSDQAVVSACANDFGYEYVFSRQVEAFGRPGDILIPLSTSGKSANVLRAIDIAKAANLIVIEPPRPYGHTTARIQELHMRWLHDLACEIEDAFALEKIR